MKLFTIFGNPVKHSISPLMHNSAIKGLNLDACYTKTLLKDGSKLKETFFHLSLSGANITVPHKETAFKVCDEVRGIANNIKAVNTLVNENGKLIGCNTDAQGFFESIKEFGKIEKALILGAGGTAKAISFIFKENNIKTTILNRSQNRLDFFKNEGFDTFSWDNYKSDSYDIIVNTTSAGLETDALPAPEIIINDLFLNTKYAIDVIYNKETPFLKKAKTFNLKTKDGADMLLYQGVLAFNLFYNNKFSFDEITTHMKKAFTL